MSNSSAPINPEDTSYGYVPDRVGCYIFVIVFGLATRRCFFLSRIIVSSSIFYSRTSWSDHPLPYVVDHSNYPPCWMFGNSWLEWTPLVKLQPGRLHPVHDPVSFLIQTNQRICSRRSIELCARLLVLRLSLLPILSSLVPSSAFWGRCTAGLVLENVSLWYSLKSFH